MKKLFFFIAGLLLYSCNIINPAEDQPAYISINSYEVMATQEEGGNTERITDAWIYVNSEFLGAFALPVMAPVLAEGPTLIEVFPGVKINGLNAVPDSYTFYARNTSTEDLQPGQITEIAPKASYLENTVFLLVEQFNDSAHQLLEDLDTDPETRISVVAQGSLDGQSGLIHLDTAHLNINAGSVKLTEYPTTSSAFYMEMDYKAALRTNVGLVGYDASDQVIYANYGQGVLPNTEWDKIYIDLSAPMTEMKAEPSLSYYRLQLRTFLDPANEEGLTEADVYVDNLKLLMFE